MAYVGPIKPGMGFLWEPKKAHAREALVVSNFMPGGAGGSPEGRVQTVTQDRIGASKGEADRSGSRALTSTHEFIGTWNDESRFREAVVRCVALDEGEFTELPGRYHLRAIIDAITDAALPVAFGGVDDQRAFTTMRARVQVEIADAVAELLDASAQNGYTDAFYAMAHMIGVPAMPISPRDAWENEIEPRLRRLIDKAKAPRNADDDLRDYGVAFTVDGEVVHPSRVSVRRASGTTVGREA